MVASEARACYHTRTTIGRLPPAYSSADGYPLGRPPGNGPESLRSVERTTMWNLISTRVTQFDYFDRLLDRPRWKGGRVLDFGGNVGTFPGGRR